MIILQNYINFEDNIIINNVYNLIKFNLIKFLINFIVLMWIFFFQNEYKDEFIRKYGFFGMVKNL